MINWISKIPTNKLFRWNPQILVWSTDKNVKIAKPDVMIEVQTSVSPFYVCKFSINCHLTIISLIYLDLASEKQICLV
jgi:hypothetical protein